jgi:prophage DNA circulation protein
MSIARNWLKTLWAASYKGVPFFVERDNEGGSRRIVEHEFPMRDEPFLEDLGEGVRRYRVTAYCVGNSADANASSVMSICATRGAGILVLPTHGPILVKCLEFERDRDKDKHGYIAHNLRFSRDGASHSLISTAILSNATFIAVDNLATQVASTFVGNLLTNLMPDFVIDAAVNGLLDGVATIDALRTSSPVDLVVSAAQRNELFALYDAIPALIADPDTRSEAPTRLVAAMRAVSAGIDPAVAIRSIEDVMQALPAPREIVSSSYATPRRYAEAVNAEEAARVVRLATIGAYAEAVAQAPLSDRQAALTIRGNVVEYLDAELESISATEHRLFQEITAVRDAAVNYLSLAIIDLAPVRNVDANQSMPALYWAWRFYKDPNRAMEIVNRNRVADPAFIPPTFEALIE